MDIVYSNHAEKRLKQRGIEEWEIEHILKYPSYIRKSFEGRKEAVGEIRNRKVKIIFIEIENYIRVIGVM
ncbi:MAG: DUF4258 domain-containing protein [Nanoarchaeota archaeon]|nr:DUF4258 domain-containing protein [Nanoarchaeota archaeon]